MMKRIVLIAGVLCAAALTGCGGSSGGSNYSIMERREGTAQVTYYVRVSPGLTQSEADSIATELRGKESKETMINIHDGEQGVDTLIYSCQGGTCFDTQPGR